VEETYRSIMFHVFQISVDMLSFQGWKPLFKAPMVMLRMRMFSQMI
jgi:hypothetical protein